MGDSYDRDVVLGALVRAVRRFRERGRSPDVVFATGDVAFSGKSGEYEIATAFFDEVLDAAGLERRDLFVISGNHDVDRDLGVGLARSLASREEADRYFAHWFSAAALDAEAGCVPGVVPRVLRRNSGMPDFELRPCGGGGSGWRARWGTADQLGAFLSGR
jgi:hypothetical protein